MHMTTTIGVAAMVLAGALALGGCTVKSGSGGSPTPAGSASPGSSTDGGASVPAPPVGATCLEVAECAGKCADGDDACANACVAKGSPAAKAAVDALDQCSTRNACADDACLQTNCQSEIATCRSQKNDGANPPTGGVAGSVPAELVGTWSNEGGGAMIVYTFSADGSYHESSGLTSSGTCSLTTTWDINGTVVFATGSVTFHRVSGTMLTETCSSKTEKDLAPESQTKSWIFEAGKLHTWGADCQDFKTCGVEFAKQ
jgi:hypothetical protein